MRPPRLAAGLVLAALTVAALPGTAGADAIAAKQAEASRLQDQIDAQGERLSILVEQYDAAKLDVDRVTADVIGARRRLEAAQRDTATVRAKVEMRAIRMYQSGTVSTPFDFLSARDAKEAGIRAEYAAAVAAHNDSELSDLRRATEDLTLERARLEADMQSARAVQAHLNGQRAAVSSAMAEQQATLSRVQGELARLVAEEQARRRAEAAARARAVLARRFNRSTSRGITDMANVPAPNARAGIAVDVAKAQIGKPYQWGAAGPDSFDCSGLTMYSWGKAGVSLPHSAAAQFNALPHVPIESLAPGDLVFYGSSIHHVGIYIGGGQMVNAPQTGETVRVDSIYRRDFAGAARPG